MQKPKMEATSSQIVGGILMAQACITMILIIVVVVKAIKCPEMASRKYVKLNLSGMDKKNLAVMVPGTVLVFICGLNFREAFGFAMHYSRMVVALNLMAFDILLLSMFTHAAGISVFLVERQKLTGEAKFESAHSSFNQFQFELWNTFLLGFMAALVIALQLKLNKFAFQGLWYWFAFIWVGLALVSLIYLHKTVRMTAKMAEAEAQAGMSNANVQIRILKSKQLANRLMGGIVNYFPIAVILLIVASLASVSRATPEEAWGPGGDKLTVVPEIGLLMMGGSYISLAIAVLVGLIMNQKAQELAGGTVTTTDGIHVEVTRKDSARSLNLSGRGRKQSSGGRKSSGPQDNQEDPQSGVSV
eukprot:TRINITY_DN13230_c0_g1_i1.p1 TRINITY_DN13230_c0_g1~~TRINITY_DN13230_c0_g1_i1.p1  ORF type:complete len:359 (-),score=82.92 TRINITY_DN13230_c0_g1_i1:677-1753(-)